MCSSDLEGTVEVVGRILRDEIRRRPGAQLGAWLLQGAIRRFRQRTAYDAVGGALLLGVEGVAVVGHGRADARAVASAIRYARTCAETGLLPALRHLVTAQLGSAE